jgi:hypothetical protein
MTEQTFPLTRLEWQLEGNSSSGPLTAENIGSRRLGSPRTR